MSWLIDFRHYSRSLFSYAAALVLTLVCTATAGDITVVNALPDYDIAGGLRMEVSPRTMLKPNQKAKLAELETLAGEEISISVNTLSQAPRSLWSRKPMSAPSIQPAEQVAR